MSQTAGRPFAAAYFAGGRIASPSCVQLTTALTRDITKAIRSTNVTNGFTAALWRGKLERGLVLD